MTCSLGLGLLACRRDTFSAKQIGELATPAVAVGVHEYEAGARLWYCNEPPAALGDGVGLRVGPYPIVRFALAIAGFRLTLRIEASGLARIRASGGGAIRASAAHGVTLGSGLRSAAIVRIAAGMATFISPSP